MTRNLQRCLFLSFFIFVISFPSAFQAGEISPDLQSILQSSTPFEEIPVIITLSDQVDLSRLKEETNKDVLRAAIVNELKNKAGLTQGPLMALLSSGGIQRIISFWIINGIAATLPAGLITAIANFPGVERISLDAVIEAPPVVATAAATPEWNISAIKAPDLWNLGFTGTGAVVASMDTGVDISHPDLNANWRGGTNSWFNPYSDPANAGQCAIPNNCSPCELSSSTPCDVVGHGTGTMGVMVGGSAGGTAIGVAPDAKWIAVKIFNDAATPHATTSIILLCFQWIINLPAGEAPDVVNNSWGEENRNGCDTTFQASIQALKAAGISVVFAAGNVGGGSLLSSTSPANNAGSFAVGATDINNTIAFFSSRGPSACDGSIFPHIVAPGVNIRLAAPGSNYTSESGTSFSAPHVAGAMALLLSAFPNLTPSHLEITLEQTAAPLGGTVPNNTYGYGLIDLIAAYDALLPRAKTVGLYDPVAGIFYLRNSNTPGSADTTFRYGPENSTWIPIVGDWDGNGTTTVGLYDPAAGLFRLKNSNTGGFADILFRFGPTNSTWIPIVGDWDGNGTTTVGLYDPATGLFRLKNSNTGGLADLIFAISPFGAGWLPVCGDWDGLP